MFKILIADDSMFMRKNLGGILTTAGHNVIGEAENGLIAAELFEKLRPDVTFLDITMPVMDGLQALKKIKKLAPQATVIMCSAMSQKAFVEEAIDAGADDFVAKPFKAVDIIEKLKKLG